MAIIYNDSARTFKLLTNKSSYHILVGPYDTLLHTHYGRRIEDELDHLIETMNRSHCGNPNEAGLDRTFSLDTQPQEYSTFGMGDYRLDCLEVLNHDGSSAVDLRYHSHQIIEGKYRLNRLPSVYDTEEVQGMTLVITCVDHVTDVYVDLYYGVIEEYDVITRAVKIRNEGNHSIYLTKALSACVDFPDHQYDMIHFYGKHEMEREYERQSVGHSIMSVESHRGLSSHQHNPFVMLAEKNTTESEGQCYGFSLLYSGNFQAQTEVDQIGQMRLTMGIHPAFFKYEVKPGEAFDTPEVAMSYSSEGLGRISHNFHKLVRHHICKGYYKNRRRPVLINNWEATYFDFDTDKLVSIAKEAVDLGIEMLVMDDGWFGNRNDDDTSLGDWTANVQKLGTSLKELTNRIHEVGCQFGIWFEPEMVNEDSNLYRAHPDWCLMIPGRPPTRCRNQLVLDLSRKEVKDYIYQSITHILDTADIDYIKWDFNRSIAEVWSGGKDRAHQGEVFHDYILNLYEILETLNQNYPKLLIEGCSSGGGRFDMGMLQYQPQIWASDNTDAMDRLYIQYGTSFGYPLSTVGSHVSAVPNHQTGRTTPMHTRGIVAMAGTFGYELDVTQLSDEEKDVVRSQVASYKENHSLIHNGVLYRLTNPYENTIYTAWEVVDDNQDNGIVSVVFHQSHGNPRFYRLYLQGLDEQKMYQVQETGKCYSGASLMYGGLVLPQPKGDYQAYQYRLCRC